MSIPLAKQIALAVVDMQPAFLPGITDAGRITQRCTFAIAAAQLLGIRVLFTEQVPDKLGHTLPGLLAPAPDAPVFAKTTFSAFGADGFTEALRQTGVRHLLLAGIETPICIYNTALHAQANDMDVTILQDCIGARRPKDADGVLHFLRQKSDCHVLSAETIFYSLLNDAAHPLFRDFTNLVKEAGTL